MKQFIVGSGWKMVKTYQDSIDTARELEKRLEGFHEFPVVIFPLSGDSGDLQKVF